MPSSEPTIFCAADSWTPVQVGVTLPFDARQWFAPPGVLVRWRWFSTGIPWYREGTFSGNECIQFGLGFFTSLQFNPSADITVTWSEC